MHTTVPPLFATLRRNPTGAILVVVQIAITLAVLCNTVSIVADAIAQIDRPAGFDTRDTFVMSVAGISQQFNVASAEREDLGYLRALHDVAAATITTGEPLTNSGTSTGLARNADTTGAVVPTSEISLDEQGLRALGVALVAGRDFRADEITSDTGAPQHGSAIIVTESLAHALFPDGHALGGTVYEFANQPLTIIGITRDFMGPQLGGPAYHVCIVPQLPGTYGFYHLLVRALPGRRDAVIRDVQHHIASAHPDAGVAFTHTIADSQRQFTAAGRNMAFFLSAVTALMLAVCCLGVFGLTAFNVSSRTKQIGVRRAVGARKRDIVAYFLGESAVILGSGAVLGTVMALALGQWLSDHYGEPRLDLACVLAGIVTLCAIGQLAAWHPARRAASVPPSIATRTV
ncbi:MAG TPA: FtsX-like permease family protein [Steroidobacteraceae bacterium]|jgi:putative ABC transport system permease protein